ncbi:MAG: hypothetical protein JF603_07185 [Acidobacteria bacterium]|nr:hypothetical protein [Acidobacteriota bacterium]
MRRIRGEDGFVGGFEALPFGFLVLVAGTLLLVNAWAVIDANLAASAAAREAVRAFVESGADDAARTSALSAAADALTGQGKDPDRMALRWSGGSARCEPVTATVTYEVPTIAVPWIGAFGRMITTSAHHTEIVDPYRGGLAVGGFTPESCSG